MNRYLFLFYHFVDKKTNPPPSLDICRALMELEIKNASQFQMDCLRDI